MKKMSKKQKLIILISIITIIVIIGLVLGMNAIRVNIANGKYNSSNGSSNNGNLLPEYIKAGITLGGVTGTLEDLDTSDATATPADIISGKTAYVDGKKITGTYRTLGMCQIGDYIEYVPSGTYTWQAEYCSTVKTPKTDDVILNSSDANYKIEKWRILSIDEENGKVEMVPAEPTKGTVYLGEAQGYNNGVQLLDEACSNLYGDSSKNIEARSIKVEDLRAKMTEAALEEANNLVYNGTKYLNQTGSAYINNRKYPIIYAEEKLSVIDGNKKESGLGISEQNGLIGRNDKGATNSTGYIMANTSIQPYETFWYASNAFLQTAFEKLENGRNYYDIFLPDGTSTFYWMSSRCVDTFYDYCHFIISTIYNGEVGTRIGYMIDSGMYSSSDSLPLFPVVTINSNTKLGTGDGKTAQTAYEIIE